MRVHLLTIVLSLFVGLAAGQGIAIPKGGYGKPIDCRVDALLDSAWGQTTATGYSDGKRCYNYYIMNQMDAAKDYAGCLAVAAGQIMRKWRYGRLAAPMSVSCYVDNGMSAERRMLTTIGGDYDWANMPTRTDQSEPTDLQCQAVGKLLYDLAVASGSSFTPTGTYANASVVRKRLSTHAFGFANTEDVFFNSRNCPYSLELLEKLLIPSLDCGAPVILSISPEGKPAVHAAVIDGYGYGDNERLMLHANLGVWGSSDGWYYADEGFNVGGTESTVVHECLYNLFPTNSGTAVSGRILDASRRGVGNATVSVYAGTTCVASSISCANGVYGFVLAAGTYQVRAVCGSRSAERTLTVGATASRQFDDDLPEGQYWDDPVYAPVVGNSFGNDLLMPPAYSEMVATPTISPGDDRSPVLIASATNVTLSCTTPGAIIRYTLDGSEPTKNSPVYVTQFAICDDVTIKAIAFAHEMEPSETATVRYVYENAQRPAGDDRAEPMTLFGTNLTRTVQKFINYTRAADDPVVDLVLWERVKGDPYYWTESHSAWFRWTAPGNGTVRLSGRVKGPCETDYYDGSVYPLYGISLAVYRESDVSSSAALARTESGIEGEYAAYSTNAVNLLTVLQGETYLIQCECPYHLQSDYIDQFYFGGPYRWSSKDVYSPFDSSQAYLEIELAAALVSASQSSVKLTVPAMPNATVRLTQSGKTVLQAPGTVALENDVDYTVIYTADEGYCFPGGEMTWTAIVCDDTGEDFSVADAGGYPLNGPEPGQGRPSTSYVVTFDTGNHGRLAAGQVAEQRVKQGEACQTPNVICDDGWWLSGWDADVSCVTSNMAVHAVYGTATPYVGAVVAAGCEAMGSVSGGKKVKTNETVSLKATAKTGYVFSGWQDADGRVVSQEPSISLVAGTQDRILVAVFVSNGDDWVSLDMPAEVTNVTKSVIEPFAIQASGGSLPTVKVAGLPAGLKFTAKALDIKATATVPAMHYEPNTVYGTPTKSGVYVMTATATTAGKKVASKSMKFIVRAAGESLVDADYDATLGKVTGMGVCAVGKSLTLKATAGKNHVFAGWYQDAAFTVPAVGAVDYRTASFAVAANGVDRKLYARFVPSADDSVLQARVAESYALNGPWTQKLDVVSHSLPSVTAKGLPTGLKFDAKTLTISGTPSKPGTYTVTLSLKNVTVKKAVTQTFYVDVANIESPYLSGVNYAKDAYVYRGGVFVGWDVGACAREGYAVTGVTGLPAGLKFNAKTGRIEGVPTKGGTFTATVTLKNGKLSSIATVTMMVNAIDAWAYGTFNGGSEGGQVQLTVSNAGKLSGKYLEDGLTYVLSAPSYSAYNAETRHYLADVTASWSYKEGRTTVKTNDTFSLSVSVGDAGGVATTDVFDAWQDNWKQTSWKTLGTQVFGAKGRTLAYAVLSDGSYSSRDEDLTAAFGETVVGKVTLSLSANGTVKTAGEFVIGRDEAKKRYVTLKVTGSAAVCATAAEPFAGRVFVYFAPNAAKGFAGHMRIVGL